MSGNHTPGPWRFQARAARYPRLGNGTQIWAGDVQVASVTNSADKPIGQKIADAILIAAAPDLLRAVTAILADCADQTTPTIRDICRAAIAQAVAGAESPAPRQVEGENSRAALNSKDPTQ